MARALRMMPVICCTEARSACTASFISRSAANTNSTLMMLITTMSSKRVNPLCRPVW